MLHRLSFQRKIWKSGENVKLCRHRIIPGVLFTLITASWNKILNATLSVDYWRGVPDLHTGFLTAANREQMLRRSWLEWQPQKISKVFQSFRSYFIWYLLQKRKIFFATCFIWHQRIFVITRGVCFVHCQLIIPALDSLLNNCYSNFTETSPC